MRESPPSGDQNRHAQARPFGSSGLAAGLGIGVFILAIIVAGVLVLSDDDDPDEFALVGSTPTERSDTSPTPTGTPPVIPSPPAVSTDVGTTPTDVAGSATPRTFPTLTPAPTSTLDPDSTVPTEPADEEDQNDDPDSSTEGTPDIADPPVAEPTTPGEESPPVEEPVAGDFGFLPAPQLPSGGAGQSLDLDYQLATSLEFVPLNATVYEITWPSYSAADVELMAANIGLDGEVTSQGDGVFSVQGSESSLFVAPTIIEYGVYSAGGGGPLPPSDVAVDAAWSWFASLGVDGVSPGDGRVIAVDEAAGLSIVALTPGSPSPNLAPTPSARVKVSAGGVVEEATIVWPAALNGSDYGLRSGIELWEDLRNGYAFVSADLSESGGGSATMNVTDISIEYTIAGSPWDRQFIVPLVVFGGTANINGVSVYVSAYVPAVYHQENPLG
jgi:hypothetical protein